MIKKGNIMNMLTTDTGQNDNMTILPFCYYHITCNMTV